MNAKETYKVLRAIVGPWCRERGFKAVKSSYLTSTRQTESGNVTLVFQCHHQGWEKHGLRGMARTFAAQEKDASRDLNFNERLALLIDAEQSERRNYRYAQRVRWAKLGQSASLEDLDSRAPRGIDRSLIAQLGTLGFINDKRWNWMPN